MLAVRTPGAPQAARYSAGCDSAFPFAGQGRLLRSRSISGLCSRSLYSGLQPPCLRFATAVTGRHARLGSRLLARLCRGRHRRRQTSTRLQGATAQIPACAANAPGSSLGFWRRSGDKARVYSSDWRKEAGGELDEPLPAEACRLASPLERCEPEPLHVVEEPPQARVVIGYQSNVRQKKDRLAAVSPNPISTWSSNSLE